MAFIVLTFGANQHRVGLAAAAAALAVLVVALAGVAAREPLARVPENTLKFAVGVMLTSFGMFWGAEGAGAEWPAGEATLLAIIPGVLLAAVAMVWWLRRSVSSRRERWRPPARRSPAREDCPSMSWATASARAVWEFVVGDDWRTAVGVVLALALTAVVAETDVSAWWVMPVAVVGLLVLSLWRAMRLR